MKLLEAEIIAENIRQLLVPYCEPERCFIAGSIRRKKPEVKDIEIVCQPKITVLKDMFDWDEGQIVDLKFTKTVEQLGIIKKGNTEGRMMQIELPYNGLMLDLFMPDTKDFFRQFAIRTGSADYSWKVIASAWRRKGWCGTPDGLRRENECVEKKTPEGKSTWSCSITNPTLPPEWKSEREFFEWLNLTFVQPENRI